VSAISGTGMHTAFGVNCVEQCRKTLLLFHVAAVFISYCCPYSTSSCSVAWKFVVLVEGEMKMSSHKIVDKGRTVFLCPRKIPLNYYYYYYYYYYYWCSPTYVIFTVSTAILGPQPQQQTTLNRSLWWT